MKGRVETMDGRKEKQSLATSITKKEGKEGRKEKIV